MVTVWSVDFYRRPCYDSQGQPLWELLIDAGGSRYVAWCSQSEATAAWLTQQLKQTALDPPTQVRAFRPQTLNLLEAAALSLGWRVEPDRRCLQLKTWLQERARTVYPQQAGYRAEPYDPLDLPKPPPQPLPEKLWGERWQFAALSAPAIEAFRERPIPFLSLLPDLSGSVEERIPGVIIYAGRQSLALARWLAQVRPACLNYLPGDPDGLILEAGLVDRWVLTTFSDLAVKAAGEQFETRKQVASGLHFLSVQPDDSGLTDSGFWLLQTA